MAALKVLEAEFPAWHLIGCFDVFHLTGTATSANKRGAASQDALAKLAQVFGVDRQELSEQYVSLLPSAQALQKRSGLDNRVAWATALKHVDGRADLRQKYPSSALKEAGDMRELS